MASSRQKDRQILAQQSEDGDTIATLMRNDLEYECSDQSLSCEPLKVGDWVYIYSATHAFVGQIAGMDHEEYVLAAPVSWVFDTGALERFVKEGIADYCELYPAEVRVRRGGTVIVARYPLARHPKQRSR